MSRRFPAGSSSNFFSLSRLSLPLVNSPSLTTFRIRYSFFHNLECFMHVCSFRPLKARIYFGGNSHLSNLSFTSVTGAEVFRENFLSNLKEM